MNLLARSTLLLALTPFLACSGGDDPAVPTGPTTLPAVQVIDIIDGDNAGDASDVDVDFAAPSNLEGVGSFRVFLLTPAQAGQFDNAAAEAAPATSYVSVSPATGTLFASFDAGATDVLGQPAVDGGSYAVRIQTVAATSAQTSVMSAASGTITLARTNLVKTLVDSIDAGPGGLSVNASGTLFFGDYGETWTGPFGSSVWEISATGTASVWVSGFDGASGNTFMPNGDLLQVSLNGGRVDRVSPGGAVTPYATGIDGGAYGIAMRGDTAYVITCNNRMYRILPDGTTEEWVVSDQFDCGTGVTVASDGNLYVTADTNGNLVRVTPEGDVLAIQNTGSGDSGQIVFGNGLIYVAHRQLRKIISISPFNGEVKDVAGNGLGGHRDGSALDASLEAPFSIAISPDGTRLYFSDMLPTVSQFRTRIKPNAIRMVILVDP